MPASRRSPKFVGRLEELGALVGLLGQLADGRPGAALVAGEAGVGKTRLLEELAHRAEAREVQVLVGGCVPLGGDLLPYAPFVEALRGRLSDLGHGEERPGTPTQAYQFERVLGLLAELAAKRPLLLVLEDLHWADTTTLRLVAFLVRNLRRDRVAIVASYRSDELGRGHPLRQVVAELSRDDAVVHLDLSPFDVEHVAALLTAIEGGPVPPEVAARVHARAQGNPFFAEELYAADSNRSGELPTTLREVVLSRLTGLLPAAVQTLRACAVAGGRADHVVLVAASNAGPDLDAGLRQAVDRGLLRPDVDGTGYAFRHELVGEAIYADLLPFERARLHGAVADALASQTAPAWDWRRPAEIAAHRLAAHDLDAALTAFVAAGDAAGRVGAFAEARRQFETGLELWDRVPDAPDRSGMDRIDLLVRAADAANLTGDPNRAVALGEAALAAADPEDRMRQAELYKLLGHFRWAAGRGVEALAAHERAVALSPKKPPHATRAHTLAALAYALLRAGRYTQARRCAADAIAVAQAVGAREEEGRARTTLGVALVEAGDVDAGLAQIETGRRIAVAADRSDDELAARRALGDAYDRAGRLCEAVEVFAAAADDARQRGLARVHGAHVLALQARTLMRLGHWRQAEAALDEAVELEPTGAVALVVAVTRAMLLEDLGRFEAAEDALQRADDLASHGLIDAPVKGWLTSVRGGLAFWRGDLDAAAAAVTEGLACLEETDDLRYRAELCVLGLRVQADRADRARLTHAAETVAAARVEAQRLTRLLADASPGTLPTSAAERASGMAELARLDDTIDTQGYLRVAEQWHHFGEPWPEAYARWRAAEVAVTAGSSDLAGAALRDARQLLAGIEDGPLVGEIDALARRARIPLSDTDPETIPAGPPDLGLTPRELEVLAQVREGRTNAEIGDALYISEKTVSVHVSNLMRKLGVSRRVEAAAIAHRLDLQAPSSPTTS